MTSPVDDFAVPMVFVEALMLNSPRQAAHADTPTAPMPHAIGGSMSNRVCFVRLTVLSMLVVTAGAVGCGGGSGGTAGAGGATGATGGMTGSTGAATGTTVLQGIFIPTGSMTVARADHTATLMPSGMVLIAGGSGSGTILASAELYDPADGTFTATGSMTEGRFSHTATLLPNGKVLVAGGGYAITGAELYDPSAGTFTPTGSMTVARECHTATLLPSGKVLVAGGTSVDSARSYVSVASAELYDPTAGTFTPTGSMTMTRSFHTATLLPNGKVLVAGGESYDLTSGNVDDLASAELYDPSTGTFAATGSMAEGKYNHTATLLSNGNVFIAGGYDDRAEVYNPSAGTFTATGSMAEWRDDHTATLLPSGKVLIIGGESVAGGGGYDDYLASAELYDPSAGTFTATGSMTKVRRKHTATLLPNGKVLVVGGYAFYNYPASAELYQ